MRSRGISSVYHWTSGVLVYATFLRRRSGSCSWLPVWPNTLVQSRSMTCCDGKMLGNSARVCRCQAQCSWPANVKCTFSVPQRQLALA